MSKHKPPAELGPRSGKVEPLRLVPKDTIPATDESWQELLEHGHDAKVSILSTDEFFDLEEASDLLGISEEEALAQIAEHTLFAVPHPDDQAPFLPDWALLPYFQGETLKRLIAAANEPDEWAIFLCMGSPQVMLNGLTPIECLVGVDQLPARAQALRNVLYGHLKIPVTASLLPAVEDAIRMEIEHNP